MVKPAGPQIGGGWYNGIADRCDESVKLVKTVELVKMEKPLGKGIC